VIENSVTPRSPFTTELDTTNPPSLIRSLEVVDK
jgi:hypothetical protein